MCAVLHGLRNKTGGCINSSPAGKRRIAVGAEQQLNEDLAAASLGLVHDGSEATGLFSRVASPFTTITALTVAACLLVVTIFVIIFAVLQVILFNELRLN